MEKVISISHDDSDEPPRKRTRRIARKCLADEQLHKPHGAKIVGVQGRPEDSKSEDDPEVSITGSCEGKKRRRGRPVQLQHPDTTPKHVTSGDPKTAAQYNSEGLAVLDKTTARTFRADVKESSTDTDVTVTPVRKSSRQRPPHLFLDRKRDLKSSLVVTPAGDESENVQHTISSSLKNKDTNVGMVNASDNLSSKKLPKNKKVKKNMSIGTKDNENSNLNINISATNAKHLNKTRHSLGASVCPESDSRMQPVVVLTPLHLDGKFLKLCAADVSQKPSKSGTKAIYTEKCKKSTKTMKSIDGLAIKASESQEPSLGKIGPTPVKKNIDVSRKPHLPLSESPKPQSVSTVDEEMRSFGFSSSVQSVTFASETQSQSDVYFDAECMDGACVLKIVLPEVLNEEATISNSSASERVNDSSSVELASASITDKDSSFGIDSTQKVTTEKLLLPASDLVPEDKIEEKVPVIASETDLGDELSVKQEAPETKKDETGVKTVPIDWQATQCTICYKPFRNLKSFLLHLLRTPCGKPENYAQLPGNLGEQLDEAQSSVKEATCPLCAMTFAGIAPARAHYLSGVCMRVHTPTVSDIHVDGINYDSNTKKYLCPACGFQGKSHALTAIHYCRMHAEKTLPCKICGRKYAHERLLQEHTIKIHQSAPTPNVNCDQCGKTVKARYLKYHINTMHNPNYKPLSRRQDQPMLCPEDDCTFQSHFKSEMYRHRKRVHEKHQKICEDCGRTFALQADLTRHRRERHQSTTAGRVECPQCKKRMLPRNLSCHIRQVHQGERRYACSICGMLFQTQYVLRCHEDTHKAPGERKMKYLCTYCGRGFRNRTVYTDHLNVHTGARPYSCTMCNKTFRLKNVMQRHLDTHSSNNRHSCDVCSLTFATAHNLYQHRRRHCDSTYTCMCGAVYQNFKSLRLHRSQCLSWTTSKVETPPSTQPQSVTMATVEEAMLFLQGSSLVQENGETMVVVETPEGSSSDEVLNLISPHMLQSGEVVQQEVRDQVTILNLDSHQAMVQEADGEHVASEAAAAGESLDRFLCGYCQELFLNFDAVQDHMMLVHAQDTAIVQVETEMDVA